MQAPPAPRSKLTVRHPGEFLTMTFDEKHVIIGPHLLCRGQNAAIVGPGGVGKSRLQLQMAICNIINRVFVGFSQGNTDLKWLVMQVENDNRRLQHDFQFYQRWVTAADWKKVEKQLFVHALESDDDGFLSLDVGKNRQLVTECIGDLKPDVVTWDALIDFGFGDLNKDMDMFASLSEISRITRLGDPLRTPVILHHALTGREGASKAIGWERAGYSRGSKALHMWTRLQINVAPGSEAGDVIVIGAGKCSDSKEFPPFAARLNPDTMIYEKDSGFDLRGWRADVQRKNAPAITDEEVAEICGMDGIPKRELVSAICTRAGCVEKTALRAIERAEKRDRVIFVPQSEKYVKAHATVQ